MSTRGLQRDGVPPAAGEGLGYLNAEIYDSLSAETVEVRKMIYGLLRKL